MKSINNFFFKLIRFVKFFFFFIYWISVGVHHCPANQWNQDSERKISQSWCSSSKDCGHTAKWAQSESGPGKLGCWHINRDPSRMSSFGLPFMFQWFFLTRVGADIRPQFQFEFPRNFPKIAWKIFQSKISLKKIVLRYFLYPPQTKLRGYIVILMSVRSFVRPSIPPNL